ncbi:MAG: thioesterase family protein [Alphaproteobacteria bacterium]|nr:thioesterase family protein [Alphaproteobacteria bacterium]
MAPTDQLKLGMVGTVTVQVTPERGAPHVGSGSVEVFATPMLVAVMEAAAVACVDQHLPETFTSLGTNIDVQHTAATPIGMTATAVAELIEVAGRKLTFKIAAHDDCEPIGSSTHTRMVVDRKRFDEKLKAKAAR